MVRELDPGSQPWYDLPWFVWYDGGFDHVPESADGRVNVLGVDHILLLVERDPDLPPLLDPVILRDSHHGYTPKRFDRICSYGFNL